MKGKFFWIFIFFLIGCGQEKYWEKTLSGPFTGEVYSGELKTKPISSIALTSNATLESFFEPGRGEPIIRMIWQGGVSNWTRVLVAKASPNAKPRGQITEFRFEKVKASSDGYKVFFNCNWTAGGREAGIIRISSKLEFESFGISW
jgi:hypothetical protein